MRILLIGHGRMGQLIEQTALAAGDEITGVIDINNFTDLESMGPCADVVIDFSSPASLSRVADYGWRTGTPLPSGTTGRSATALKVFDRLGQHPQAL